MTFTLIHADCVEAMRDMDEASVDAIVTDPPYGLEFMGKEWDRYQDFQGFTLLWADEALRVLKPGGHLLAFGGTRTFHRLTCALEDAGFEIRDCLSWLYGSGFPKSLDVSKAIDKAAGAEREVVGRHVQSVQQRKAGVTYGGPGQLDWQHDITAPATPDAQRWQGWGTALKPAWEPVVLARKPLVGTVAANVLEHGTGAINVDGCRVEIDGPDDRSAGHRTATFGTQETRSGGDGSGGWTAPEGLGRWPANVVLDETAAALLDEQSGERPAGNFPANNRTGFGGTYRGDTSREGMTQDRVPTDTGGASRFFYTAKAGRAEREIGAHYGAERNGHPTVKPVDLMQWLCRLVTPPKGVVLDPFTGSGSTGIAALREGFEFIGIEREAEYVEIARARIIGDAPLFNQEVTPTDRPA